METLYRKVAVSERTPKKKGKYFAWINEPNADNDEYRMFKTIYKDDYGFQSFYEVTHWLEEITDNTQIEKLEADKDELLEFMKELKDRFEHFNDKVSMSQIESLIQKMKQ